MTELFTERELSYLAAKRLGRLATVGRDGRPHVVPVGYRLRDDNSIEIAGPQLSTSRKWSNIARERRVAFVVDDMTPEDETLYRPGVGRGVEVLGDAELEGVVDGPEAIVVHPAEVLSWHIDPKRRSISVLADRGGRL